MKVKQLIEELLKLDPELDVVIAKDSEGNGFSPFYQVTEEMYQPINKWFGELVHPEDAEEEDEEYIVNSVVIWGVN